MVSDRFPQGATLAELEEFLAQARRQGAEDDARPRVTVHSSGEIATMSVPKHAPKA